ncbi:MAG TPA: ABC transporter permease [Candidatus Latescibacteria bacterium]|nr:ABC transporter permease [Candidatus Latescibacterota bacterium]
MNTFDLERAIADWTKALRRNPVLEDGHVTELEACMRDEIEELVGQGAAPGEAFLKAVSAMGRAADAGQEFYKAHRSRRSARPSWQPPRFIPGLFWSYIQVALRKIKRQKGYSFINIASLAVGLACSVLMMLWVREELGFDRFHANRDSIYRLVTETRNETAVALDARAPTPLGPAIKSAIPEVVDFCRYRTSKSYPIKSGDKISFGDLVGIADPSFFTMFTFPFLKGDPKTALDGPRSIVVTESLARKFFGDEDPMGKLLTVTRDSYTVTGVIRDVPENSHLHFACVIPIINMREYHHVDFESWNSRFFNCYVRLAPRAGPSETIAKISGLLAKSMNKSNIALRIQPLKDIHLRSEFAFDLDNYAQGSASTLTLFSIAAAAILLLACINFMNLATARSANRAKEVGLRKVTGARRSDIVRQFLGESVVLSFLGLGLALLLIWAVLPLFNGLAGKQLPFGRLFDPGLLAAVLGVTLLAGLLAGSYPALYLASFEPARVLKGTFFGGERGQAVLRKSLVVLQFALTVFFVMGTIIVDKQLRFVRAKNLGIDTHQVVTTQLVAEGLKEPWLADSRILSGSQSAPPGSAMRAAVEVSWEGKSPDDHTPFFPVPVDPDYIDTFRAEMAEGRFFAKETASDRTEAVVVNETAARAMGSGSALGKRLTVTAMSIEGRTETMTYTVVGVMRDFHQTSLRQAIEPMVFTWNGDQGPWINLRISPVGIADTIKFLETTWKSFEQEYPFRFEFLDDMFDAFYKQDRRTRSILGVFMLLALFTACLGLVGLASFIAEKKTKEIGIRKVLGASARGIVLMQTREFLGWVLVANVVALPAAYLAAGRWLQGFAYRVNPGVTPALLATAFSLMVAFLSVAYKAVQAARANPIDSLRFQ